MQDLKLSGKRPVVSDKLTMLVIVGRSTEHFLRIDVGIGSRSQVKLLEEDISLEISFVIAGMNSDNKADNKGGVKGEAE